jgi:hypothetical protein
MKNYLLFVFLLAAGMCLQSGSSNAQVIVKVRPVAPAGVVVRPAMRGAGMVWIDPEWHWNRQRKMYVWREGHWAKPHRHEAWFPGHWVEAHEGYNWVPGYWGRRR